MKEEGQTDNGIMHTTSTLEFQGREVNNLHLPPILYVRVKYTHNGLIFSSLLLSTQVTPVFFEDSLIHWGLIIIISKTPTNISVVVSLLVSEMNELTGN